MDYFPKLESFLGLPESSPKRKKKKKIDFFKKPIVLVIVISFLVGTISGLASSLIFTGLIGALSENNEVVVGEYRTNDPVQPVIIPLQEEKIRYIDQDTAIINMVQKASPAVVSIVVTEEISRYTLEEIPLDPFFRDWPGFEFRIPQYQELPEKEKKEIGRGTGFFVSSDGLILTNKHVVYDQNVEYSIITSEGKNIPAQVLATDPFNDIAIIKVEGKNFPYLALGDSDKIDIGQTVIAIGFALGEFRNTVTKGVISGIGRSVTAGGGGRIEHLEDVIQTDAAINPGNSGGPLLNLRGEVIGINTAISRQGQLIGFAISSNIAKDVIESVKKTGKIVRPFLGIRYVIVNQTIAETEKLSVDYGALIIKGDQLENLAIAPGSAAEQAGLKEGDIILEFDGEKITQDNSLIKIIKKYKAGDEVVLKVLSEGKEKTIKVVLGEYKE